MVLVVRRSWIRSLDSLHYMSSLTLFSLSILLKEIGDIAELSGDDSPAARSEKLPHLPPLVSLLPADQPVGRCNVKGTSCTAASECCLGTRDPSLASKGQSAQAHLLAA